MRRALRLAAGTIVAAFLGGCISHETCCSMMRSADPLIRAKGCKLAGDAKRLQAVGPLVDRLEDRDAGVRFFAINALHKITGTDMEYRESDPPAVKARAVARWRQYAAEVRASGGARP